MMSQIGEPSSTVWEEAAPHLEIGNCGLAKGTKPGHEGSGAESMHRRPLGMEQNYCGVAWRSCRAFEGSTDWTLGASAASSPTHSGYESGEGGHLSLRSVAPWMSSSPGSPCFRRGSLTRFGGCGSMFEEAHVPAAYDLGMP